jgi:hypothetical protein
MVAHMHGQLDDDPEQNRNANLAIPGPHEFCSGVEQEGLSLVSTGSGVVCEDQALRSTGSVDIASAPWLTQRARKCIACTLVKGDGVAQDIEEETDPSNRRCLLVLPKLRVLWLPSVFVCRYMKLE